MWPGHWVIESCGGRGIAVVELFRERIFKMLP